MLLELVFRQVIYGSFLSTDLIFMTLYVLGLSIFLTIITSIFKSTINNKIFPIISILILIFYISNFIYFKVYGSFYSLNSMKGAWQVFKFKDHIIDTIKSNILPLILVILATVCVFTLSLKLKVFKRAKIKNLGYLSITLILVLAISFGTLFINKDDVNSRYKYYYSSAPGIKVTQNFGMLPGFIINIKKELFGTKEIVEINNAEVVLEDNIEYNISDIDFDKLISNESDSEVKLIHEYVNSTEPTEKNEYTGVLKDKNIILILAESFDWTAVDEELTPTIYKLFNEGLSFNNFYTPLYPVSTSDGEYMARISLLPIEGEWTLKNSFEKHFEYNLGNILKEDGYTSNAYHNYKATYYNRIETHPNLGYTFKACGAGLDINCDLWVQSDLEMVEASIDEFKDEEKFITYYVTMSGHLEYSKWNAMASKNWDEVEDLEYEEKIKSYMAQSIELDKALETLLAELEESGELEDTVIAMSSDHYPYGLTPEELNVKSDFERDDTFDLHKTPFVIWNSELEHEEITKIGSNLDILPTLLNLYGVDYDSRLLMGKDLLSNSESLVMLSNHSFKTETFEYDATEEKITGDISEAELNEYINSVENKFAISKLMYDKDYYRIIFEN